MEKSKKRALLFPTLFCSLCLTSYAQQNTVAAGNNATGAGGNVSYSIGQIDYFTSSGGGGFASQGVQQPYEIYITSLNSYPNTQISLSAFPNPVTDLLNLNILDPNLTGLCYKIFSEEGKLLNEKKISNKVENIDFQYYSIGIYFVKIINNQNKEEQVFKIIKN